MIDIRKSFVPYHDIYLHIHLRQESRGAHYRPDFPNPDDDKMLPIQILDDVQIYYDF